jgi:pimeloyl-ACP methyl ester carboxylesterase
MAYETQTPVGLVLVHGGSHGAACWQPTVEQLAAQAPGVPVLAVDLPGRGSVPADLGTVTVRDWVDSVVAQVDAAGLHRVVLVAHSMAGITVPAVAARLGPDRVQRLLMVAACVPPQGESVMSTLAPLLRRGIERQARRGGAAPPLPRLLARFFFCNGMTRAQRAFALAQLCPDASQVAREPVDRTGLSDAVPRTWVLTTRDRAMTPQQQRRSMAHLGQVEQVVEIDTCHEVMISEPRRLAEVLVEAVRSSPSGAGQGADATGLPSSP